MSEQPSPQNYLDLDTSDKDTKVQDLKEKMVYSANSQLSTELFNIRAGKQIDVEVRLRAAKNNIVTRAYNARVEGDVTEEQYATLTQFLDDIIIPQMRVILSQALNLDSNE